MANENTLAVLEAAINKDPLALKEALNAALMEKVGGVIDAMRSGIFEAEDCDCADDDDEDEDDKKSDKDDEDDDEEDEDLDEETVVAVMETILEAAAEEGIELDEEELVELSKETLKSYKTKAHAAAQKASAKAADHRLDAAKPNWYARNPIGPGRAEYKAKYKAKAHHDNVQAGKQGDIVHKRREGIRAANRALRREE